jgi:SAM-dependent methyltransferase
MIDPKKSAKHAHIRVSTETSIDQHLVEILSNRKAWDRKPTPRKAYSFLYRLIRGELVELSGLTVELGSGIRAIKQFIPACVTTDIFPNPWLERTENAYRLSFEDRSIANLILFDVFHHLKFPGEAFKEFERVIGPGGRLILMEPGFGWLGRFIYQRFHHEPLGFDCAVPWNAPHGFDPDAQGYYAAQANAWRIFVRRESNPNIANWRLLKVKPLVALSYVASGGFTGPSLYPEWLFSTMVAGDRLFGLFPSVFATRLMVVLERLS